MVVGGVVVVGLWWSQPQSGKAVTIKDTLLQCSGRINRILWTG